MCDAVPISKTPPWSALAPSTQAEGTHGRHDQDPSWNVQKLSWHVQKLGSKKLNDPAFIAYVAHVSKETGADVVGIMEVVGWIGKDDKEKLLAGLKSTAVRWQGAESEPS